MGLSFEGLRGQAVFLILLSLSPILADSRDKGEPLNHLVSLHCVKRELHSYTFKELSSSIFQSCQSVSQSVRHR